MTLTSATSRYDKYKDSGIEWIGEIPDSWLLRKFKYIFKIISGNGFPEMLQGNPHGDYPFCKCSDINGQKREIASAQNYVDQSTVINYKFNIIPIKSIIIAKIGETLKKNHRKINIVKCVIDNNMEACVFQNFDAYNIIFYFYILTCIDMLWFDNGGTIPSINNEKLKNFYLPCTSIKEQEAIAGYLDKKCGAIDETIEKQKSVIEKLKEYKQSIIAQAVTKGLDKSAPMKDSGIEWIGQIPQHWEIIKFKNCISKIADIDHYMPNSVDIGYPYLMTGDLKECASQINFDICKKISSEDYIDLATKIHPQKDDIIFARYATIGTLCYVDISKEFLVSYSCLTIRPLNVKVLGKFIFYYLKSDIFTNEIMQYVNSNTQSNIGLDSLKRILVILPNVIEQKQIISYLDKKCLEIDKTIEDKEKLIEKLVEYKKSLIYECVTGKKRVI